ASAGNATFDAWRIPLQAGDARPEDGTAGLQCFLHRQPNSWLVRGTIAAPSGKMLVRTEEFRDRAERARSASAFVAKAQPDDSRARLDAGQRAASVLRCDPDRCAAVAAARDYLDVAIEHGADTERVDGAHCIDGSIIQPDSVAGIAVGEWIG